MSEAQGLRQKATTGVVWVAIQKYAVTVITFVSDIVLARLLTPYDFGCIEMLAIFMLLSETLVHGGFGAALIQKKRPTQEDYSTIFFWNLGMAALMYLILYCCAPAIARFYKLPELSSVLRVQGLVLFVYAFNIVQSNQLRKQFRFKAIAIVAVVTSFISLGVTILMAYCGYGVWSLVAKNMIATGLTSLIFWFYLKWRPTWVFSWKSFKELFSFGFFIFLSNLVTSFSTKLQGLLIGRVYSPSTMGYYSKASGAEGITSTTISQILDQVTYPLYAEAQDDLKQLGYIVKRLSMAIAYVTFPLMFVLILIAKPLFVLLYSEKWLPSVPYFQVLCLGGLAQCLQSINFHTISAIGKSKVTFLWTMIKRGVGIVCIVGGLYFYGLKGILVGAVFNAWFAYFVNMGLVSKYIGYKWYSQIKDLLPVLLITILFTVICYCIGMLLHLNMYLDGLVKLLLFLLLFLCWSFVFNPEAYVNFKDIITPLLSKIKLRRKSD